jgi:hypothetical protein
MMRVMVRTTIAACAAATLAACDSAGGPQMGTVRLYLTDAPLAGVANATVWISRAEIVGGSGGPFLISDTDQEFDLLALQGGVTAYLGDATIPVGDYAQLRLIVDSARLTLEAGQTFDDGSSEKTLFVPSGMQTGIKVTFAPPVHVAPGVTSLVADFDVSRSFVFQGPPGGPHSVSFKPVIHATAMDVAGSISGTVTPASANATLFAIVQGTTDTVASAAADGTSGAYTLHFLPPADYTVAAVATGFQPAAQNVTVAASQQVTGVDFTLVP